mgnify:CR=1 FL=1
MQVVSRLLRDVGLLQKCQSWYSLYYNQCWHQTIQYQQNTARRGESVREDTVLRMFEFHALRANIDAEITYNPYRKILRYWKVNPSLIPQMLIEVATVYSIFANSI